MHPAAGFLALPSVGMRLAPEILILELFRDVFYAAERNEKSQTRELTPDFRNPADQQLVYGKRERAVILAFRGRRKQSRQANEGSFYAPAYPALAAHAWLAKNRERIISQLLFNGAIAQHLWGSGSQGVESKARQRAFIELVANALSGTRKIHSDRNEYDDILAACLPAELRQRDMVPVLNTLEDLTSSGSKTVFRVEQPDKFASRVFMDFEALCREEKAMPRLLWLRLMMTYLRFSLPMWLLAQMRMTVLAHNWVAEALGGGATPDAKEISLALSGRNRGLIRPTLIPTGEVSGRIREYVRCRIELNVMLYVIAQLRPAEFGGNLEITALNNSSGQIRLADLLLVARRAAETLQQETAFQEAGTVTKFVARYSERFAAWRDPLANGQGKNIEEFLRVLYRADRGDEAGGHLLVRHGRGDTAGFRVFPGQMLLQLVALLAIKAKQGNGGRLVLKDIEEHFEEYGINFSLAAEARPQLMAELQSLGLLAGSPDAGSSVAVTAPF